MQAVWEAVLADRSLVKKALASVLRGAATLRDGPSGPEVEISDGPAAEWLDDPTMRRDLEKALALHSGRDSVKISIGGDGGAAAGADESAPGGGTTGAGTGNHRAARGPVERVTAETVRETRLKALVERAPQLEQAIAELDLELMD